MSLVKLAYEKLEKKAGLRENIEGLIHATPTLSPATQHTLTSSVSEVGGNLLSKLKLFNKPASQKIVPKRAIAGGGPFAVSAR